MRRAHFDLLRPVCPVCRQGAIAIDAVVRETEDDVLEGILSCTDDGCRREYPIVDGIPILVAPIRGWLAANPLQLLQRDDLSPVVESLIGDVSGPGSPFDTTRQHISIYASDHYGGGSASTLAALDPGTLPEGPLLDAGCSVGGTTFALAARHQRLTLGIDLNLAMLRVASRVLREGRLRYAKRRVGVVFDRVDESLDLPARELVDFWCCDVSTLPFSPNTFALGASINVVDCISNPQEALRELARVLLPGAPAIITTPYDWSPTATPYESWLGGHSQRGPHEGASEPLLRQVVSESFEILREDESVPWRVRLHDRSTVDYLVHVLVGRKLPSLSRA